MQPQALHHVILISKKEGIPPKAKTIREISKTPTEKSLTRIKIYLKYYLV